jgi:hypothetical protein
MRITADPIPEGKCQTSKYDEFFSQLAPKANCIVCDDVKKMDAISSALIKWVKKNRIKAKVRSSEKPPFADKKPRVWLVYEIDTTPPATVIKGNWISTK